jgi:hypothetical protein
VISVLSKFEDLAFQKHDAIRSMALKAMQMSAPSFIRAHCRHGKHANARKREE